MSSRDMPAMRTLTWIADVKSGWEWKWFDEFCARPPALGTLATIGFDLMTPLLFGQVENTIAGRFDLVKADEIVAQARSVHRPREITLIRAASELTSAAAKRIAERWRAGDDVETAAVSGEGVAREMAAQDVRTLVSPCLSGCLPHPLVVVFSHAHGCSSAWRSSVPKIANRVPATFP
jgi:Xaa-Pro aminopeptidase